MIIGSVPDISVFADIVNDITTSSQNNMETSATLETAATINKVVNLTLEIQPRRV